MKQKEERIDEVRISETTTTRTIEIIDVDDNGDGNGDGDDKCDVETDIDEALKQREVRKREQIVDNSRETSSDEETVADTTEDDVDDDPETKRLVENLRKKYLLQLQKQQNRDQTNEENAAVENSALDQHLYMQPINRQQLQLLNSSSSSAQLPAANIAERKMKYLSRSDEDLRMLKENRKNRVKVRVISRHPIKRPAGLPGQEGLVVAPRLTRSIERINIEARSSSSDDDDLSSSARASSDYGEIVSVTGIGSNPLRRVEIEREKRRLQNEFFNRIASMEKQPDVEARLGGSTKLDELIEIKLRREYAKAVRRINKRKWRVPQLLAELERTKGGKERKKLEDELILLMRKAKIDNELVKKFEPYYGDKRSQRQETASIDSESSQQRPTSGRYLKNTSRQQPASASALSPAAAAYSRHVKKTTSQNKLLNKTFESGYSSLDEYMSGGDLRTVGTTTANTYVSSPPLPPQPPPLRRDHEPSSLSAMVQQVEQQRQRQYDPTYATTAAAHKMSDVYNVEAPRVEPLQEIRVGAVAADTVATGGDGDDDDDYSRLEREQRRRPRARPPPRPAAARPNNYVPTYLPRQQQQQQEPQQAERYESLAEFSATTAPVRSAAGGTNSPPTSRPTTSAAPPPPAARQTAGSGSSASSYQSNRSTTAPNSIYVNVTSFGLGGGADSGGVGGSGSGGGNGSGRASAGSSSPNNRQVPSSPSSGGGSSRRRTDSSGSESRRPPANEQAAAAEEQQVEMKYSEEDDLAVLDPNRYDLVLNEETGESVLVDLSTRERYTVLPRNWRTTPHSSYYMADADVDFTAVQVYSDGKNKRRYVYDPRTERRYFLVPLANVVRLAPDLRKTVVTEDAPNVIHMTHETDASDQEIEVHYVEESELEGLDLTSFSVYRDDENGEVLLVDAGYPNRFWIVLRDDWRMAEDLPYLAEEDVASLEEAASLDVYTDATTRRKYVIDEKTGERYFLVPKFRENIRNYVTASNVPLKSGSKKTVGFGGDDAKRRTQSVDELVVKKIGDENVWKLDKEPSTTKLRKTAANSPEKFKNRPLVPRGPESDPNRIVIKQPGKPGHVIKKPTTPTPTSASSSKQQQTIPKRPGQAQTPTSAAKSASPAPRKSLTTDPVVLRVRQEAARRAFFNQKLPYVGELWLHQQLVDKINTNKKFDCLKEAYLHQKSLEYEVDPDRYIDPVTGRVRSYRDLTDQDDPTLNDSKDGLDPDRLVDVQMYGYEKYNKNKKKKKIFGERDELVGRTDTTTKMPNNKSFGGFEANYPFVRGILTEDFVEDREYAPVQLNPYFRALFPYTKLNLRQQFLLSPGYLRHTWNDVVHRPDQGLTPRIILIDDDERIITKNRECNVYVQYYYEHDGVLGADPAYQLMLPDRGPTKPARPLTISPAKLSKKMEMLNAAAGKKKPQTALRETPVFVYHPNGSAYFENLAQYLANKQPQLSPSTVRKMLQFADLKEFEDYLAAKCTREEAQRIADSSGDALINVDAIKGDLIKALSGEATYYDAGGCEYDPLRPYGKDETVPTETRDVDVNGTIIQSTFIGIGKGGNSAKRVKSDELPPNITSIVNDAMQAENNRKSLTT